jgi:hypothetical protein
MELPEEFLLYVGGLSPNKNLEAMEAGGLPPWW